MTTTEQHDQYGPICDYLPDYGGALDSGTALPSMDVLASSEQNRVTGFLAAVDPGGITEQRNKNLGSQASKSLAELTEIEANQ